MPLQNRVDPWGQLHAVTARGTLLGNRGIIHNLAREIVAPWRIKAWITCQLTWRGRRRTVMQPGSWTELFFLDEATAFAAGHRPCAYCRRERFREFKTIWLSANPTAFHAVTPRISAIDTILHSERTQRGGKKVTYEEALSALPEGTMIELGAGAYLLWNQKLLRWSFSGYSPSDTPRPSQNRVRVLTPASIVRTFRNGFRPEVHESADLQ
ncbi:MAG: hypothetical protein AB7G75_14460 [Candidatus Binatia bacterium]